MAFDATFWVAISFVIFFGVLIYFKIPQKVYEILEKLIIDIKNEIKESEKLRAESKTLLDNAKKSETYQKVLKIFPDAELIDIDIIKEKNDD